MYRDHIMFLIRACSYGMPPTYIPQGLQGNVEALCVSILRMMIPPDLSPVSAKVSSGYRYDRLNSERSGERWNALTERQRNAGLLEQVISF